MIKGMLCFLGAGHMAEAIMHGLLKSKIVEKEKVVFTEIRDDRSEYIGKKFGIKKILSAEDAVRASDIIVLAVKPQNMDEVLREITSSVNDQKLIITIAAGLPIQKYENQLGKKLRIVRVMPNMAALVGFGISGISAGRFAREEDIEVVKQMMASVGDYVELPEESLDAVTAVSGSGPAFFFFFMEAIQEAGVKLGLSHEVCKKLVEWTALGAGHLVQETKDAAKSLRKKVTSPGGTTEAAIEVFEKKGLKEIIVEGVLAAEKRSKELKSKT